MDPAAPEQPIYTTEPVQNTSFFQKKRNTVILIIISWIIFILSLTLFLSYTSKNSSQNQVTNQSKSWEITLSFNSQSQSLSFKKLALIDQNITPDTRPNADSLYKLAVLGKDDNILYQSGIHITEQLIFNVMDVSDLPQTPSLQDLETTVYVPYFPNATQIVITKENILVLKISIPSSSSQPASFKLVTEALAQTNSCGGMQVVFISDGYSNSAQFNADVETLKTAFNNTAPYSGKNIFDFKVVPNQEDLGCRNGIAPDPRKNRAYGCIQNPRIKQIGLAQYPSSAKYIVLVNNPNAGSVDGGILGVVNGIGGDIAVFSNRTDYGPQIFVETAVHEFLGHAVGKLQDRYLYGPDHSASNLRSVQIKSNCTERSTGESFWTGAGSTGTYLGCTSRYLYAPFPLDCGPNGYSQTVMSSGSCTATPNFDSVEQAWISNNILPAYSNSCTGSSPTPIASAVSSPAINNPVTTSGAPVVVTERVDNITATSATVHARIEPSFRGSYIKIRGVQYYDDSLPNNPCSTVVGGSTTNPDCKYAAPDTGAVGQYGAGPFSKTITGLLPGHSYTVRAYAVDDNNTGTLDSFTGFADARSFGNVLRFSSAGQATGGNTTGNNTPGTTGGTGSQTSSGSVYVCEEVVTTSNEGGKQIQIKKLECSVR